MSRRPHHYDADLGGIRHAKNRALSDRTKIDAGGYPGVKKGGCGLWFWSTGLGLIGGAGVFAGWLFAVLS